MVGLVVLVVLLYDSVDYLVTRRGVQQAMQVGADKCSSEVREEGTMQANAFAASVLISFADKRGGKVEGVISPYLSYLTRFMQKRKEEKKKD